MYYLITILFGVVWILTSIVRNYASTKSPISHKYLNHGANNVPIRKISIFIRNKNSRSNQARRCSYKSPNGVSAKGVKIISYNGYRCYTTKNNQLDNPNSLPKCPVVLNPYFISGLVDAEGCFRRRGARLRFEEGREIAPPAQNLLVFIKITETKQVEKFNLIFLLIYILEIVLYWKNFNPFLV